MQMNRKAAFAIALMALALATPGYAETAKVKCTMTFKLEGWSAIFETASGTGSITCSNGQHAKVKLDAKGGGLTVGKSSIDDGQGEFSAVNDIGEIFGSYASADAHAGAVKSGAAHVMTKGKVSLAWHGTGRGWDVGVGLGRLKITRV